MSPAEDEVRMLGQSRGGSSRKWGASGLSIPWQGPCGAVGWATESCERWRALAHPQGGGRGGLVCPQGRGED